VRFLSDLLKRRHDSIDIAAKFHRILKYHTSIAKSTRKKNTEKLKELEENEPGEVEIKIEIEVARFGELGLGRTPLPGSGFGGGHCCEGLEL
jgi:hypothetical protein